MWSLNKILKIPKSFDVFFQCDSEHVTILQSNRNFLFKSVNMKFFPEVNSLTRDISSMINSEKDGILPKVNEILKDLILYEKILDRKNKQTSPQLTYWLRL